MRLNLLVPALGALCVLVQPAVCQDQAARTFAAHVSIAVEPRGNLGLSVAPAPPSIRVDSMLVLIPVMVTDRFNRLVTGLGRDNFKLFDESIEQNIVSFSSDDAPMSIGLVFDCSGSMENKMGRSRAAVAQFLAIANPEDEFFLVQFNSQARLVQPFTAHAEDIQDRLAATHAKGATALFDAVHLAISEMKNAKNPRRALLIVSDGGDNNSRYTQAEIKSSVKEADLQIFAIGIHEPRDPRWPAAEELAGPGMLAGLSEQTGGRLYPVKKIEELPEVAATIGQALRSQYILGFAPPSLPHSGKYRRVEVKVIWPKGPERPRAFWRHGYYAPAEPGGAGGALHLDTAPATD
ncbi:MAG: VWA domain-containing protein [Acidobacteriia bacterium]|nr:VWA domain-containing protein [Terriglobia bacterium]